MVEGVFQHPEKGSVKEGIAMPEVEVGRVSDFFAHPSVAGVELTGTLEVGDRVHIVGHTTNVEMVVGSIQVNSVNVARASAGQAVGIKVPDRVRRGDTVHKITE